MTSSVEARLEELGVALPVPGHSVASYVPCVRNGDLVITSGQLPLKDGALVATGLLGRDLDVAAGQDAARWCAVNVLAQTKALIGDLGAIKRVLKITVFVAATQDFGEHHLVANGASDLLLDVLGERGEHSRSAIGVAGLPLNAPVEIEAFIHTH